MQTGIPPPRPIPVARRASASSVVFVASAVSSDPAPSEGSDGTQDARSPAVPIAASQPADDGARETYRWLLAVSAAV